MTIDSILKNQKEQERYENKIIWEAVVKNKEIAFLNSLHFDFFKKPLGEFYLNYALDALSEYKILYSSVKKAKFKSIKTTLDIMETDYLVESIINEAKKNKKGIDGKITK